MKTLLHNFGKNKHTKVQIMIKDLKQTCINMTEEEHILPEQLPTKETKDDIDYMNILPGFL